MKREKSSKSIIFSRHSSNSSSESGKQSAISLQTSDFSNQDVFKSSN